MEPSAYYFYVKTNISIDFQICISVPLISHDLDYQRLCIDPYKDSTNKDLPLSKTSFHSSKIFSRECCMLCCDICENQ